MKKNIISFLSLASVLVVGAAALVSCSTESELSKESTIYDTVATQNDFDKWLNVNYMEPYNITFEYRFNDIIADMNYDLTPADLSMSKHLAKLTLHLVMDVYDEVSGSSAFMKKFFPKTIQLVGSPCYNNNGSIILGTAEGGKTMLLYNVNALEGLFNDKNISELNNMFFKTMHHEFSHILHQTKPYSSEFQTITSSLYVGQNQFDTYPTDESAHKAGFVSPYSATNPDEDFVEILSIYITSTDEAWAKMLSVAGNSGADIINRKTDIVKSYMLLTWGFDMDKLRATFLARQAEVWDIDNELN